MDLCDESIESNEKIENIDTYIQKNVIQVVENFHDAVLPANKKQPDRQLAFKPSTLPKELFHQLLSFLIPIETPLYPKGMAALSLTCWTWYGHLIVDLMNKHVEIDKLMERTVQPLQPLSQSIHENNSVLLNCLAATPYKEYFLKYLENKRIYDDRGDGNYKIAIDWVLYNSDQHLVNVLNIVPESWPFLRERKKVYPTYSFMRILVRHLKLPESEKEWKLFNQLKEANFFNDFTLQNLENLPEDRCNFFIKEFKQNIELSSLTGLQYCAKKCRIPILHRIGEVRLRSLLDDGNSLFWAINNLHGKVALELIKILDDQLVNEFKSQTTFFSSRNINALYIYQQLVDPKNLIKSKFREVFSTCYHMHTFNQYIFLLIPDSLRLELLKLYPVDKDIFRLLDPPMQITVLSKKYDLSKLKPDEIVRYLDRKDIWRVGILCRDKKTIFDLLHSSVSMESKLHFLRAVNDLAPLNERGVSKDDFYTILNCLEEWQAREAMLQYYSQFNIAEFECQSFIQKLNYYYHPAPIIRMVNMVNLFIKDLNDINNLKTQRLLEVKNWLECTKQFDKPHQNQVLLLIRDICALKQGDWKMFTPQSEASFLKQCKHLDWHVLKMDAITVNLIDIPPILDSITLETKSLDMPALMVKIEHYLACNYTNEARISALKDSDYEQKPPQGQP